MAAAKHGGASSSSSPLISSPPQQSFMRVILPHVLQAKQMVMPQNFVGLYGSELLSTAELFLPNGAIWTVGVAKRRNATGGWNEAYFGEKLAEFVGRHSIRTGFFLRFDYLGDSKFSVKIYDTNCCGITYRSPSGPSAAGEVEDTSVENFFRLIMPSVIEEKQLPLAIKFARKHGRKLAMKKWSNAQLCLPNGTVFEAGITAGKDRKELWFKRGWSKFMDDNSIKQDFFLTFEYAGDSRFNECKALLDDLEASGIEVASKFNSITFPKMSPESKTAMREAIANKRSYVPSFIVVMMPAVQQLRTTYRITVPTGIVQKLKMKDGDWVNLKVSGGGGSGGIEIVLEHSGPSLTMMGKKWTGFYYANQLKEGASAFSRLTSPPPAMEDLRYWFHISSLIVFVEGLKQNGRPSMLSTGLIMLVMSESRTYLLMFHNC